MTNYSKSKYEDVVAETLDAEDPDDEIGSVDELGNYRRYNDELVILLTDQQGFVWTIYHTDEEQLAAAWEEVAREYRIYDQAVEDEGTDWSDLPVESLADFA